MLVEKYGYWEVSGKKFDNSYEAFLEASNINSNVNFYYHHDTFSKFDKRLLGKIPLNQLYKERARQLRDSYDYLILYYSGGADSHNVLCTFIENNIKLDEICIKWPKPLRDGKFYNPNSIDISANNYWSEWDFAVKPVLDWITQYHPEIKITFKDYTENLTPNNINSMFEHTRHHSMMAAILLNSQISDSEEKIISLGKKVGNIYGLDKPLLSLINNKIKMFFTDNALRPCSRSTINIYGSECFYWTPDMPLLAYEQAYQLSLYYKTNRDYRKFLMVPHSMRTSDMVPASVQNDFQAELSKKILYSNWDDRFQAKKGSTTKSDKFFWFFNTDELTTLKNVFLDNVKQRTLLIDKKFLSGEDSDKINDILTFKILNTPGYDVNEITD
jgi:hypothetical protein